MNQVAARTLLALAGAGTLGASTCVGASASTLPTTYSAGDLLLGFREIGSTNSVVLDLGPFTAFTSGTSFAINAGAALAAQYGSGWASNANVLFSLASTDSADRTSYVSSPEYASGPSAGPATVWSRQTGTNALIFQNKVNGLGGEFTSNYVADGTLPEVQPSTEPNAYANYMPGGTSDTTHATQANIAWGYFNPTSEGNLGQGTGGVALDLIQLVPGTPGTPGSDLGVFQLSSDGNTLSYTPSAVPEPGADADVAVAAGVGGALALLGWQAKRTRRPAATKGQAAL